MFDKREEEVLLCAQFYTALLNARDQTREDMAKDMQKLFSRSEDTVPHPLMMQKK